ncbi:MAG: type II toxin-antitoxin system Phd/YefM family antitoxin [Thermoanaerobaculia bacterium]
MKTLSVRDFRTRPAQARRLIGKEGQAVLASNGKPFALVLSVTEDTLDGTVVAVRRARALQAMEALQRRSLEQGKSRMTLAEINRIVNDARRRRRRAASRRG